MDAEAVCHAKEENKMDLGKADSIEYLLLDNSSLEKPFRFLDLPPEIRNNVYQCACIYETPSLRRHWAPTFADLRQAPITRVNKQIRNETLPIFYGNHHFFIQLPPLPSDWQSLRPRHENYQDPVELVWKRLNAFTPDQDNNLQANSLRFLSKLTLKIEFEPSRQWRLAELGFTMSSMERVCAGEMEELVKTTGLDWNKCLQVKEAYLTAADSCPAVRDSNDHLDVPGVCCAQVDQAASALAVLMCRIAKLCPRLTNNVSAFSVPTDEFMDDLFDMRTSSVEWLASSVEWLEDFGIDGDEY